MGGYRDVPQPADMRLARVVWNVCVDEFNNGGPGLTIDEVIDQAGIDQGASQATNRTYARRGIHYARTQFSTSEGLALICDRSTNLYSLSRIPDEVAEYGGDILAMSQTTLKTLRHSLVAQLNAGGTPKQMRQIRLVKKWVDRLIEDLADAVEVA